MDENRSELKKILNEILETLNDYNEDNLDDIIKHIQDKIEKNTE
jgi:hypothetical protein